MIDEKNVDEQLVDDKEEENMPMNQDSDGNDTKKVKPDDFDEKTKQDVWRDKNDDAKKDKKTFFSK